ncbi:hypothetical protein PVAP13_3KG413400 [Panicum virgatum]|uniref:Uncharacterized protein n=1 Tax=Panicum virgatum TaxID=38727 RepID=A0A8T0V5X3_PANVG|nr:hypothetical protein PVAP13_3KG413400 [Panicum virgatum]
MSDEAAASGDTSATVHPSSASTRNDSSSDAFEAVAAEFLSDLAEDDKIEAQLFRGASPGARRQTAAQQEALRRQVAESRAQARRLKGPGGTRASSCRPTCPGTRRRRRSSAPRGDFR